MSAVGLLQSKEILPPPPPRPGGLEHSPSFARGCSLCSVCHHFDLRFVGELGGQISIDRLGPQGSDRGGGAWEDLMTLPALILTCLPVKEGSTRLAKSTPRAVNARTGSTVSVPSGGKPPARPTMRGKAKDAPTDDFCLSLSQRGYALESKRATLRSPCIGASLEPAAEVAPEWPRLQPLPQSGALLPLVPSVTCRGGLVGFDVLLTRLRRAPLWAPAGPRAGNKAVCRKATSLFARRGHPDHSPRASPFQCATVALRR